MRFPPEFIDRLRNHLPISEVVGKRVAIKRHGREYQGLCPFHKEKSPSFTVSDEKGFYHCFGCGAHGDAIGFIMQVDGVGYPDAVERLAIEAGLPVPKMTREAEEFERKRHTLEDVTALAARWFIEQMQTPAGKEARDYLQNRGVSNEVAERFGVGYAPNSREALKVALIRQGISEQLLIDAGLLARPDEGATYDRFRGRLMFPIRNHQGKPVAFGGRVLPSVQSPNAAKYLNSPETALFKKGEMLFAYDIAGREARTKNKPIIVAEGYMDVIALHQGGFTTAVAPLGTAVTESQLRLMWRASPEPIMCLDGDNAGARAMVRAAELALAQLKPGFGLQFATLSAGEDPDSLIRKAGVTAMQQALAQSMPLSKALWEHAAAEFGGTQSAEKKAAMEQYLMQAAERITDPIMKQQMRQYFRDELYRHGRKPVGGKAQPIYSVPLPILPDATDEVRHIKKLENQLVSIILLCPGLLHHPAGHSLHHADIEDDFGRIEFTQPLLDKLRSDILEISHRAGLEDSASLCEELARRGHDETVKMLLQDTVRNHPPKTTRQWQVSPAAARAAWALTRDAYTDKLEDREIALLTQQTSEGAHNKIIAMKKQREERHRVRYTIAPDEQSN